MCQLLGMNCAEPTDFCFSFSGFARRGGDSDCHSHGWGLAFYEGRGLRCFIDPLPASQSPVAALIGKFPIKTFNMVAHIRYATQGCVSAENVHPFTREMWGIQWCFAHNGDIPRFSHDHPNFNPYLGKCQSTTDSTYIPVGETDSEFAFCAILNALKAEFSSLPTLPILYETLQRLCREICDDSHNDNNNSSPTIFNFLLGCGQYTQFAFSWPGSRKGSTVWNGLYYTIRTPPFSTAQLTDMDYSLDFSKCNTALDRVAVIATKPLTKNEHWTEFKKGELLMFDKGVAYSVSDECHFVECQGRGLYSKFFKSLGTTGRGGEVGAVLSEKVREGVLFDRPGMNALVS